MFRRSLIVFTSLSFLSACSLTIDPRLKVDPKLNPTVTIGDTTVPPSCSATLANSTINADQLVPVSVQAAGGTSPYKVIGQAGSFASTTTVSRSYSNASTSNKVIADTVSIIDAAGSAAQCDFTVTVKPASGGTPTTLACAIDLSPDSPTVGQDVFLLVSGTGGTAPYSYQSLSLGASGSVVSALAMVSATQVSGRIDFSSPGLKTISIQAKDAQNNIVSCSKSLTVRGTPTVTVAASPSVSVPVGQTITLNAASANFAATPTFTFTTSEPGITITPVGSTALVSVANGAAHPSVAINVSATASGETASSSISLAFTATTLSCHMTHTGSLTVGSPVTFAAIADSGEALQILSFNASTNSSVTAQTNASRTVTFSTAGSRTVQLTARSLSSGLWCNSGSVLQDPVVIGGALACSVATTTPGWAYAGQTFFVYPVVSGGYGAVTLDSLTLLDGSYSTTYQNNWNANGLYLAIQGAGTFQLRLNIHDAAGTSASCTAAQVVYW